MTKPKARTRCPARECCLSNSARSTNSLSPTGTAPPVARASGGKLPSPPASVSDDCRKAANEPSAGGSTSSSTSTGSTSSQATRGPCPPSWSCQSSSSPPAACRRPWRTERRPSPSRIAPATPSRGRSPARTYDRVRSLKLSNSAVAPTASSSAPWVRWSFIRGAPPSSSVAAARSPCRSQQPPTHQQATRQRDHEGQQRPAQDEAAPEGAELHGDQLHVHRRPDHQEHEPRAERELPQAGGHERVSLRADRQPPGQQPEPQRGQQVVPGDLAEQRAWHEHLQAGRGHRPDHQPASSLQEIAPDRLGERLPAVVAAVGVEGARSLRLVPAAGALQPIIAADPAPQQPSHHRGEERAEEAGQHHLGPSRE